MTVNPHHHQPHPVGDRAGEQQDRRGFRLSAGPGEAGKRASTPMPSAGTSSASGLYQFIEQSWLGVVKKHGAEHGMGWAANAIGQTRIGRLHGRDRRARQAILQLRNDPTAASADGRRARLRQQGRARRTRWAAPRPAPTCTWRTSWGSAARRSSCGAMQAQPGRERRGAVPRRRARQPQRLLRQQRPAALAVEQVYRPLRRQARRSVPTPATSTPQRQPDLCRAGTRTWATPPSSPATTKAPHDALAWAQRRWAGSAARRHRPPHPAPDPRHRAARVHDARRMGG